MRNVLRRTLIAASPMWALFAALSASLPASGEEASMDVDETLHVSDLEQANAMHEFESAFWDVHRAYGNLEGGPVFDGIIESYYREPFGRANVRAYLAAILALQKHAHPQAMKDFVVPCAERADDDTSSCDDNDYAEISEFLGMFEVVFCLVDGLDDTRLPEQLRLDSAEALIRRPWELRSASIISRVADMAQSKDKAGAIIARFLQTDEATRRYIAEFSALRDPPWYVVPRLVQGAVDEFEARYRLPIGADHGLVEGAKIRVKVTSGSRTIGSCELRVIAVRLLDSVTEPVCSDQETGTLWREYDNRKSSWWVTPD